MAAAAASSPSLLLRPISLKFEQYFPIHLPPPSLPRLSKPIAALTLRSHGSANFNVKCFLLPEKRKQSCFYNSNRLSLSSRSSSSSRTSSASTRSGGSSSSNDELSDDVLVLLLLVRVLLKILQDKLNTSVPTATERTSVIKLQVGLSGMARSLQRQLNRIAEVADTSTSKGLSYVLTETALALLRHPDYCISAYSSVDVKRSIDDGEKLFNQLSIEERAKFDEETLVNVNNIRRQSTASQKASDFSNEYMMVTILVAAEGVHKLPPINGSKDLKEALQKLASIPTSKILAVEVLWTPQDENDTLSKKELIEDYPDLRPL
ncbi:hypothetical protein COLO4_15282 [Corchorus olitorius]|uniref:Uncharacterized protein n=1 Tax=Corchorus olitorius TaxID=93759 RepID=A0A1R3JNY2_9ROSI|nr:hypothetical protein COLO4_15282 [Corchorus olitorius]